MSDFTIIQLSPDELRALISEAVSDVVAHFSQANEKVPDSSVDDLMSAVEICQVLRITRKHFDHVKPGLLKAGMFQIDGKNSKYVMTRGDFNRWMESKKTAR